MLATGQLRLVNDSNIPIKVRGLFDMGAEANLMTEQCAKRAGLKIEPLIFKVKGVVGSDIIKSGMVHVKMNPWFDKLGEVELETSFYIMKKLPITNERQFSADIPEFRGITLADPDFNKGGKIDVLLGVDTWSEIFQDPIVRSKSGLCAQNTKFGYAVLGAVDADHKVRSNELVIQSIANLEMVDDLNELLKRFWELENPDIEIIPSEDKRAEEIFTSTLSRAEDGKYIVRIPFEEDEVKLGDSKLRALNRFKGLEVKLARDPEFRRKYNQFMNDYLEMGHMRLATQAEIESHDKYYIPHHAVAIDTKFRTVFDTSAITTNGKSINDIQLTGPNLQQKLVLITMRFRLCKFVLSADIKKMYRQIRIHPDDMNKQLIFWRFDPEREDVQTYALTTVTYGMMISPFLALRTMLQIATDYEERYPLAAFATRFERYMDDHMSGADTEEKLMELYRQLNEMLAQAGMELGKWKTNSPKLLKLMNADQQNVNGLKKLADSDKVESLLGLCYQSGADCFLFQVGKKKSGMSGITKRSVSSIVSSIFDPNGYVAPVILLGKSFLSELWLKGVDWDDTITDTDFVKRWQQFCDSLSMLNELRIPRWIQTSENRQMEFHGFADASKKGYGAVIYVRVIENDSVWNHMLISRTKIAPNKILTIPKLELCAATMLAKLMKQVRDGLSKQTEPYYLYSDSMVTLSWLKSKPSQLKPFVANRVSLILEDSDPKDWNYVPTKQNPADLISRGMNAKELLSAELWWNGPRFLSEKILVIEPLKKAISAEDSKIVREEIKSMFIARLRIENSSWLSVKDVPLVDRVHSLTRLARITVLVQRAKEKFRTYKRAGNQNRVEKFVLGCDRNEMVKAIDYWVKYSQLKYFSPEFHQIETNGSVEKSSSLIRLTPYADENSLLRVRGRIENANVPEDERHPIIIPAHSQFSRLILKEAHFETMHGNVQAMLHYLRARYWVIGARRVAATLVKNCVRCVRYNEVTHEQLMNDLPKERLTQARPFHFCGVDYFGPITIKRYEGRCKSYETGYAAVFICMTTRMVHIECVSDMTSERFLWALARMSAIYQMPVKMFSDNAKTFIGAANQLIDIHETWKSAAVGEFLSEKGTIWKFIAPRAPSHGGLWEAAVKSAKYHLKRILQGYSLTFERFQTLLSKISAVLNSRPLGILNDDPKGLNYITPAHAIMGQRIIQPLSYDFGEVPLNRVQQIKLLDKLQQDFWQCWRKDYIV